MSDFSDPRKQIQGEVEDSEMAIRRKENELNAVIAEYRHLVSKKETIEAELEDMYKDAERLKREARKIEEEYDT